MTSPINNFVNQFNAKYQAFQERYNRMMEYRKNHPFPNIELNPVNQDPDSDIISAEVDRIASILNHFQ